MKAMWKNIFNQNKSKDPVLETIHLVPIFNDLKPKELKEIKRLIHERQYKQNEPIFKKQAPAEGMYVIVDGSVTISDPDTDTVFAKLGPGNFFGELALLDEEPRSATAIANAPSTLVGFFRTDLLTLMHRSPELGNKILMNLSQVLGERLRQTNLALIEKSS